MLVSALLKYDDFQKAGFPIISIIFFVAIGALAILSARSAPSYAIPSYSAGRPGSFGVMVCSLYLLFSAFWLVIGPSIMRQLSIHLFLLSVAGLYGSFTGHKGANSFFLVFGVITFMCMIGSAATLGYGRMITSVTTVECNAYFGKVTKTCKDDGYLEWLRVLSAFGIYALVIGLVFALTSFQSAKEEEATASPAQSQPAQQPVSSPYQYQGGEAQTEQA